MKIPHLFHFKSWLHLSWNIFLYSTISLMAVFFCATGYFEYRYVYQPMITNNAKNIPRTTREYISFNPNEVETILTQIKNKQDQAVDVTALDNLFLKGRSAPTSEPLPPQPETPGASPAPAPTPSAQPSASN